MGYDMCGIALDGWVFRDYTTTAVTFWGEVVVFGEVGELDSKWDGKGMNPLTICYS